MKDRLIILCGDALEQLRTLPDESVHCCVTSPPYWGLRDYGVPGQLGLEKTPEEYVAKMVEVFREVKRVLREDGTCWVNLGDSYARDFAKGGSGPNGKHDFIPDYGAARKAMRKGCGRADGIVTEESPRNRDGTFVNNSNLPLKPKDLCGIPWRVAFALQADGWYLRSDIIWHKPNPMPESVTDRPTKSHEYLFLLSKNERYFYDAEAIKEQATTEPHNSGYVNGEEYAVGPMNRNGHSQREDPDRVWATNGMRNKRTVWTVPSFAFPESHFATYPPDLIKPCILAGTSAKGCCEKCGAPRERQVENSKEYQEFVDSERFRKGNRSMRDGIDGAPGITRGTGNKSVSKETVTIGWQPTCECNDGVIPCTVLDPFGGSGTTGMVALELGRKAILIELNPEYVHLIKQRCDVTPGLPLA